MCNMSLTDSTQVKKAIFLHELFLFRDYGLMRQSYFFLVISETDTMYGGVSAFPKSSTIVTGLKAKKMYKGYTAKQLYE